MHRPATRVAAGLIIGMLAGAPAATAAPGANRASAPTGVTLSVSVTRDGGHDGHAAGDQEVAEWPEWARTGGDRSAGDSAGDNAGEKHAHSNDGAPQGPAGDHGSHGATAGPAAERPRALVLGSFAAVNGAVLLAAAAMRRRTRAEVERRRGARAAALRETAPASPSGRARSSR